MKIPELKSKQRKQLIVSAIVVLFLISVGSGAIGFVSIANIEDISGTISVGATNAYTDEYEIWTWDIKEPVSPAFDSSSIKGTLSFEVNIITGDVAAVRLQVDGISEGSSPGGSFWFTPDELGGWTLYFDTLQLLDGEYIFTIYGTPSAAEGSDDDIYDVPFSSFGFVFEDGAGTSVIADDYTLILVIFIISIFTIIIVRRFRK